MSTSLLGPVVAARGWGVRVASRAETNARLYGRTAASGEEP
ncbi:hypothetical protein [Microbispora triticiradicis]|nr:hypothetical protein [Microbispora triticiradicis]